MSATGCCLTHRPPSQLAVWGNHIRREPLRTEWRNVPSRCFPRLWHPAILKKAVSHHAPVHFCSRSGATCMKRKRKSQGWRKRQRLQRASLLSDESQDTFFFRLEKSIGAFEWRWRRRRYQVMTLRWVRRRPVVGGRNARALLQGSWRPICQDTELFQLDRDSVYPQTCIYRCWTCLVKL